MRSRRTMALAGAVVGVLCALSFASGASAASGGGCQLKGTAAFAPGLGTTAQPFTYSFGGDLTGCQSTEAGSPASGTVSAGEPVTIGGKQYQEPVPSGNGGCASSTTSGFAIVTWADATQTIVQYTTTGAAAAVSLQGTVLASLTIPAINPQPGDPPSATITTTRYGGSSSLGLLTFQPPDPTACNTPAGVATAGISGFIGLES
jgi:hypothetical protein